MCRVRNATYDRIGAWCFGFERKSGHGVSVLAVGRDSYPDNGARGGGRMGIRPGAGGISQGVLCSIRLLQPRLQGFLLPRDGMRQNPQS